MLGLSEGGPAKRPSSPTLPHCMLPTVEVAQAGAGVLRLRSCTHHNYRLFGGADHTIVKRLRAGAARWK